MNRKISMKVVSIKTAKYDFAKTHTVHMCMFLITVSKFQKYFWHGGHMQSCVTKKTFFLKVFRPDENEVHCWSKILQKMYIFYSCV